MKIHELAYEAYIRQAQAHDKTNRPVRPLSYDDALEHTEGDLLGDFIVVELFEGTHNQPITNRKAVEEGLSLITRACDELGAVQHALATQLAQLHATDPRQRRRKGDV